MNNANRTKAFLSVIDDNSKSMILNAIANHYGITKDQALDEITHPEAEHLLDYMTGPFRAATSVLMRKFSLRG